MSGGIELVRWAQRVQKEKIRQLYETDARGVVDEDLIDEVGYAFFARCESIVEVTAAAPCPCSAPSPSAGPSRARRRTECC